VAIVGNLAALVPRENLVGWAPFASVSPRNGSRREPDACCPCTTVIGFAPGQAKEAL